MSFIMQPSSYLSPLRSDEPQAPPPREFQVLVDVFISNSAAAALRRPPVSRKKTDKRDSLRPSTSNDDARKLKESNSWMTLARGSASAGHWRSALCTLTEQGERCILKVYVDESLLYQTINVHLLNHTDIRTADRSLNSKPNCIILYCDSEQRWSSAGTEEPLCMHFPNEIASNSWLVLLRSYAIPEIYGRFMNQSDGGLYRLWRQVHLQVMQGRNLGVTREMPEFYSGSVGESDGARGGGGGSGGNSGGGINAGGGGGGGNNVVLGNNNDADGTVDLDAYCEIYVNGEPCARTTTKRAAGAPDWHESFTFSELPPFEALEIVVYREKKVQKPVVLGTVRIVLANFRRGEEVEGWFPVLQPAPVIGAFQAGDLRLKLKVDEEIILPSYAYQGFINCLRSRNSLDWIHDLEKKLQLKSVSSAIISISIAKNRLVDEICEIADREVCSTPHSHHTLFRGNTVFTKTMEACMVWYGRSFIDTSVGGVIRRICLEKVAIEVDPLRSGKNPKEIERGVEQLIYWCREVWNSIYDARGECPEELRRIFQHIRHLVEKQYVSHAASSEGENFKMLPYQSVNAFCFLRLIVPSILHPHLFGLVPGLPGLGVQRSLTLIAKVMQSLANLNPAIQKEEFMRGVKDFIRESIPAMQDYIIRISTPDESRHSSSARSKEYDRHFLVTSIQERRMDMPILVNESIPMLPHVQDKYRQLAIICSVVVRNAKNYQQQRSKANNNEQADEAIDKFCAACFDVEEQALHRVSKLARRVPPAIGKLPQPVPITDSHHVRHIHVPSTSPPRSRKDSTSSMTTPKRRSLRLTKPGSPSLQAIDTSAAAVGGSDTNVPSSPESMRQVVHKFRPATSEHSLKHFKSQSSDSAVESGDDGTKGVKGLLRGMLSRK